MNIVTGGHLKDIRYPLLIMKECINVPEGLNVIFFKAKA